MRTIGLLLAVLLMASSSLAAGSGARFSPSTPIRIMPLGDSLTAGGYNENGQFRIGGGYRVKLDQLLRQSGLNFVFVGSLHNGPPGFANNAHEGHSGWRIDQITASVTGWLNASKPDIILLMIGTNDIVQNDEVGHMADRFETLLNTIQAASPKATVIVSGLIPTENERWNIEIQDYNQEILNILRIRANGQLFYVDMYDDAGLRHDRRDLIDGVHPNPVAYEKLAPVWADAIMRLF